MTEKQENVYLLGQQALARQIASRVLHETGQTDSLVNALIEVESARYQLRSIFEEKGWEWPGDDLHLGDVIEKHLWPLVEADAKESPPPTDSGD